MEQVELKINDVFITDFWGVDEVCLLQGSDNGLVWFRRLEAIKSKKPVLAQMENDLWQRINKRPLHQSVWYNVSEPQTKY